MTAAKTILRERQLGPFHLAEKSYAAGSKLPMHKHAAPYVSLLLRGGYLELSQQEERVCSAGMLIWHPRGEAHADHFDSVGGLMLDVEVDRAWLDDAQQALHPASRARVYCGGRPFALGLQLYRLLAQEADGGPDLATELLSFFFSGTFDRQPPPWFQRALEMAAVIGDHKLTLSGIGREVGIHPVHVARSFLRFTGATFGDYLAQVRIRAAFDMLVLRRSTIAEVAYTCGFADHAHLCRTFKAATGLTPSQFQRRAGAGTSGGRKIEAS